MIISLIFQTIKYFISLSSLSFIFLFFLNQLKQKQPKENNSFYGVKWIILANNLQNQRNKILLVLAMFHRQTIIEDGRTHLHIYASINYWYYFDWHLVIFYSLCILTQLMYQIQIHKEERKIILVLVRWNDKLVH
jgi:hypothetical protein